MKKETCRLCSSRNLREWLDLGHHPHSDQFKKSRDIEEITYPLRVSVCQDCRFNQLTFVVAKEELYTKDYLYESSITATMGEHWQEFTDTVIKTLNPKGLIVDIGSNDGTLLSKFKAKGFEVLGIDPCAEVTAIAESRGIPTITNFFSKQVVKNLDEKVSLAVGTNVFAHIDDLDEFMDGIKELLTKDGVFVFESPYFGDFLTGLEYDTVYHQHLSYLSLKPLVKFLAKFDMEVFNINRVKIHGGCFRVYVGHKGQHDIEEIVRQTLSSETWSDKDLNKFAEDVRKNRLELLNFCNKAKGKKIAIISTPAKGMTLLNYTGIAPYISYATDKSKLKQGRYTPGTFIKIEDDKRLLEEPCDYYLLLAWNFEKEILANLRKLGVKGEVIIPIPKLKVIKI